MLNFKILLSILLFSQISNSNLNENIYVGKSNKNLIMLYRVYYDPRRTFLVIEIHGTKYGSYDYLTKVPLNNNGLVAISNVGKLYNKGDKLFYRNSKLKIDVSLNMEHYSDRIDDARMDIFFIHGFLEINHLNDSLHTACNNYPTVEDYRYYRDIKELTKDYTPAYRKKFYDCVLHK